MSEPCESCGTTIAQSSISGMLRVIMGERGVATGDTVWIEVAASSSRLIDGQAQFTWVVHTPERCRTARRTAAVVPAREQRS